MIAKGEGLLQDRCMRHRPRRPILGDPPFVMTDKRSRIGVVVFLGAVFDTDFISVRPLVFV